MEQKFIIMTHSIYHKIKYLRATFLLALLFFVCADISAQFVRINLTLASRPSAYLAEWYRPANGMVVLTAMNGAAIEPSTIRFQTELYNSDGQLVYKLPYQQSQAIQIAGSAVTLYLDNILQLQNGSFGNPQLVNSFSNGGKLPAGQYSIKLQGWEGTADKPKSEWTATKLFLIVNYQLPQLMQPDDGKELEIHQANSFVTFRWTPLTPSIQGAVASYRIQIWQVLPNQTPMQSLRSTPPLEDRIIKGTTQFIWRPGLNMIVPEPASTNQFIWTVQTLDEMQQPIATQDPIVEGRSQPFTFSFVNKLNATSQAKEKE